MTSQGKYILFALFNTKANFLVASWRWGGRDEITSDSLSLNMWPPEVLDNWLAKVSHRLSNLR